MNKKIATEVAVGIIVIIAIIIGGYFWLQNQPKFDGGKLAQSEIKNGTERKIDTEAKTDPEITVRDYYGWYLGTYGGDEYVKYRMDNCDYISSQYKNTELCDKWYRKSNLVKKDIVLVSVNHDPITCSQDPEIFKFFDIETKLLKSEKNRAEVRVIFKDTSSNIEVQKMNIDLEIIDGRWKISNIKCVFDEITGWQTYRNEKYGFEVKYPKNMQSIKQDDGVSLKPLKEGEEIPFVDIRIVTQPKNELVKDALSRLADASIYRDMVNKTIVVGGKSANEIGNSGDKNIIDNIYREIFITLGENKTIFMQFAGLQNSDIEQILSTFKFIN